MENYIQIDELIQKITAQELAEYLYHNWKEYAYDVAFHIDMQFVIEEKEDEK